MKICDSEFGTWRRRLFETGCRLIWYDMLPTWLPSFHLHWNVSMLAAGCWAGLYADTGDTLVGGVIVPLGTPRWPCSALSEPTPCMFSLCVFRKYLLQNSFLHRKQYASGSIPSFTKPVMILYQPLEWFKDGYCPKRYWSYFINVKGIQ